MTEWGQNDCCLFTANWMLDLTGIDGGAPWRGTYSTEAECLAVLERDGGILSVMERGAGLVGLQPRAPLRGDVAAILVGMPGGRGLIGAVCLGSRWATMSNRGLRMIRADHVKAWGLTNGR